MPTVVLVMLASLAGCYRREFPAGVGNAGAAAGDVGEGDTHLHLVDKSII